MREGYIWICGKIFHVSEITDIGTKLHSNEGDRSELPEEFLMFFTFEVTNLEETR